MKEVTAPLVLERDVAHSSYASTSTEGSVRLVPPCEITVKVLATLPVFKNLNYLQAKESSGGLGHPVIETTSPEVGENVNLY